MQRPFRIIHLGDFMPFETHRINVKTSQKTDVVDITPMVNRKLSEQEIHDGILTLFIPGSTASLTTIEYESGAVNDLKAAVERIAPEDIYYEHNERWGDGNGYSHVRAALLGPSLQIPVIDGKLPLGDWQQIVLLDFDNRPRMRQIIIHCFRE